MHEDFLTLVSLKYYSPGWYLFSHVWLLSQHFHDFSTQGIDAITFGTDSVIFLPLGKKYIKPGNWVYWCTLHHKRMLRFSFSQRAL